MSAARVASRVVHGRYLDSVSLMRVSQRLSALPGVAEAAVMIGSDTNKRLMRDSGLLSAEAEAAQPADLIVGVRANDEAAACAALESLDALLAAPGARDAGGSVARSRTLAAATKAWLPSASFQEGLASAILAKDLEFFRLIHLSPKKFFLGI